MRKILLFATCCIFALAYADMQEKHRQQHNSPLVENAHELAAEPQQHSDLQHTTQTHQPHQHQHKPKQQQHQRQRLQDARKHSAEAAAEGGDATPPLKPHHKRHRQHTKVGRKSQSPGEEHKRQRPAGARAGAAKQKQQSEHKRPSEGGRGKRKQNKRQHGNNRKLQQN